MMASSRIEMAPDDVLFFLHVPKTGGISMTKILDDRFSAEEIFPVPDQHQPKKMFEELSVEELARIRFVRGHFWFGPGDGAIHDFLSPSPLTVTILRDPIERVMSVFRYIVNYPDHWLTKRTMPSGTSDIAEFVRNPWAQSEIKDLQTRLIVGHIPGNPIMNPPTRPAEDRMPDDELMDIAKQRLDEFVFVGLTERFAESVALLLRRLGWKQIDEVPRLHVSPSGARQPISDEVNDAIAERNQLDLELYAYARDRFESCLAGSN